MTIALDDNHDVFTGSRNGIAIVTGREATRQGILTRLRLLRGEWYLDTRTGTPWFQEVFRASPDVRTIEREIKDRITSAPGVVSLDDFRLNIDRATRRLELSFAYSDGFDGDSQSLEVTI